MNLKTMTQAQNLNIREEDIIEKFIRAKGPGGQHINKTSSCVYLKHIPTGIEVKCQKERSQAANRCVARKLLFEKIKTQRLRQALEKKSEIEKLRRKTRKKPKRLKLKILEAKRKHSNKKSLRSKIINLD
ncbi:MAG: peptide chain release factor-like protein [Candidatus Omnitrophota bacterium]